MKKLSQEEIERKVGLLENWDYIDNAIETNLAFESFTDCFTTMTRIAFEAEKQNHHPEWLNIYTKLSIRLSTHDAGGVTERDFKLARSIEDLITGV